MLGCAGRWDDFAGWLCVHALSLFRPCPFPQGDSPYRDVEMLFSGFAAMGTSILGRSTPPHSFDRLACSRRHRSPGTFGCAYPRAMAAHIPPRTPPVAHVCFY